MNWCRLGLIALLLCAAQPAGTHPQEAFRVKGRLEKDIGAYAGGDMVFSVGEVIIAPGATGSKHRHPGPTSVYVLEGAVEIQLEGVPAQVYRVGDTFYEDPHQLHISTRNVSQTQPARILAFHLSHKGEKLTEPEK